MTANFQATQLPLTVNVPAGVQYSVGGQTYTGTQMITLPPGGYTLAIVSPQSTAVGTQLVFTSWSDGGAASHTVNLGNAPVSIAASFATQYLLSASASPSAAGLVTGAGFYNPGTQVQVFEGANPGYTFANWSGACSGSVSCVVTMNGPATVTANFNALHFNLNIQVPAGVSYTVSGLPLTGPSTLSLPAGQYTLALTSPQAVATGTQRVFVSWSDGGAQSHNINLSGTLTVTGAFKTQYLLSTSIVPAGQGTIAGGPWFDAGASAFITALGNAGYEFEYWEGGNCTGSVAACVFTMNAPTTVIGHFSVPLNVFTFDQFQFNTPPPRVATAMAYDAGRHEVLLVGGINGGFFNDTWRFNGNGWAQAPPRVADPPGRNLHALAYHAGSGRIVMAGGSLGIDPQGNPENESQTWIWDGNVNQWSPSVDLPSPRMGTHLVEYGNNVLMFGGMYGTGLTNGIVTQGVAFSDTYEWDGFNWIDLHPAHHPPPRFGGVIAYDSLRHQVVLVGGYTPGPAGLQQLLDTWIFNGNDWHQANPATNLTVMPSALAYDPSIQQTVAFASSAVNYFDNAVWTWDGATWIRRERNPYPVSNAVYDVSRQQVFFCNPSIPGTYHDWVRVAPKVNLVPGGAPTVSIDPVTGKYDVDFTLKQQGNFPLKARPVTATVNGVGSFSLNTSEVGVWPGGTADWVAVFPPSIGSGFKVLTVSGTYLEDYNVLDGNWSFSVLVRFP